MKRILSILLVFTMIAGIIPAVSANTTLEPSDVKIVYDMVFPTAAANTSIENVGFPETNGFWEFAGKHTNAATITSNLYGHGTNVFLAVSQWCAMTIYVPKKGTYDLSVKHSTGSGCGVAEVYFDSASKTPFEILAGTSVESFCSYAAGGTVAGTVSPIGSVSVPEPGKYTVIFKAAAKGDGTAATSGTGYYARQYIKEIILDGGPNIVPMSATTKIAAVEIRDIEY